MPSRSVPLSRWGVRGVVAVLCLGALSLHLTSLFRPQLLYDDFDILQASWTWADTTSNLWQPMNEHSWPLTRLTTSAVVEASGRRQTRLPLLAAIPPRLALVAAMLLAFRFATKHTGAQLAGAAGMIAFGITAAYQEAIYWYAAHPPLWCVCCALLALTAADRWLESGRWWRLAEVGLWAFVAPCWFAGGVIVGPLVAVYLALSRKWPDKARGIADDAGTTPPLVEGRSPTVAVGDTRREGRSWSDNGSHPGHCATDLPSTSGGVPDPPRLSRLPMPFGRLAALAPFSGALLFLFLSWAFAGEKINRPHHFEGKSTLQSLDPITGAGMTARAIVDQIGVAAAGRYRVALPIPVVAVVLPLMLAGAVWWWRRAADRRLVLVGGGFILGSDLLIYSARGEWSYAEQLRDWSRYNVFPWFGLMLMVLGGARWPAGGLTRRQAAVALAAAAAVFVVQLPRGMSGSAWIDPEQPAILRRLEEIDRRCREHRLSATAVRLALPPVTTEYWLVQGGDDPRNCLELLWGSPTPEPRSPDDVRRLLGH